MTAPSGRSAPATTVDRQLTEEIVKAAGLTTTGLGLRFDRVVTRVLGDLRCFADSAMPAGITVLLTLTAPIRTPAKTVQALEHELSALLAAGAGRDRIASVHRNDVRVRLVQNASKPSHRLIGFVHNPDSDATRLLDLAEQWLHSRV